MGKRIGIVGTGALGGYFGIRMADAGEQVAFVLRSDYEVVSKRGMRLTLAEGKVVSLQAPEIHRSSSEMGKVDWLIVGLKTTANTHLRELLVPAVGPKTLIVTLQNGLGNVESLAEIFPDNPVTAVLCQIGVNRVEPGMIRSFVPRDGSVLLGSGDRAEEAHIDALEQVLVGAGIHVRRCACLQEALWRKLMWNVPFNGLTVAIGGAPTDVICGDARLRGCARALMEELRKAAVALGYAIEPGYVDSLLGFTDQMGAYLPSSVLDWQAGRPVEVEAIFQRPLKAGVAAGVPMPQLEMLCAILGGLNRERR